MSDAGGGLAVTNGQKWLFCGEKFTVKFVLQGQLDQQQLGFESLSPTRNILVCFGFRRCEQQKNKTKYGNKKKPITFGYYRTSTCLLNKYNEIF